MGEGVDPPKDYTRKVVINGAVETSTEGGIGPMSSKHLKTLNELDFDQAIASATAPLLVDFGAEWCAPCKVQAKILEKLVEESPHLAIATVDIDECPDLAARFGVRGVPTLVAFSGGKETARRTGLASEASIRALFYTARTSAPSDGVLGARAE